MYKLTIIHEGSLGKKVQKAGQNGVNKKQSQVAKIRNLPNFAGCKISQPFHNLRNSVGCEIFATLKNSCSVLIFYVLCSNFVLTSDL